KAAIRTRAARRAVAKATTGRHVAETAASGTITKITLGTITEAAPCRAVAVATRRAVTKVALGAITKGLAALRTIPTRSGLAKAAGWLVITIRALAVRTLGFIDLGRATIVLEMHAARTTLGAVIIATEAATTG